MSEVFTEEFRGRIAGLLRYATTERLEEMVVELDDDPRFGAMTGAERVEVRRLIRFRAR
jgi:hypothetical protein